MRWLACLALAIAFTAAARAADDADAYKLAPGPFQVVTIKELVITDTRRKKDLQLRVNCPDGPGPFPVIIFSHGAFGSKDNYLPLTEHWASHGYVTIQANHSDSRALGVKPRDPTAFGDWPSRPADISFIIDSLKEIEAKAPQLTGKLDGAQVGVGGHSFGANTAQLVGGAAAVGPNAKEPFEDKRPAAILILSGQGPGEMLTEKSWEKFTRPFMVMTGSADGPTRTGEPAAWRKKPYELSPPGDKFLVWVEGLDHGYGGITGSVNPRLKTNEAHVRYTKIVTTAFWDAYLKRSGEARAYLESDKLHNYSGRTLTLEHK